MLLELQLLLLLKRGNSRERGQEVGRYVAPGARCNKCFHFGWRTRKDNWRSIWNCRKHTIESIETKMVPIGLLFFGSSNLACNCFIRLG